MEFKYVIINFLILLVVLFLVGKNKLIKLFETRHERILRGLAEAENVEGRCEIQNIITVETDKTVFKSIRECVDAVFEREPYKTAMQAKIFRQLEDILFLIKLTNDELVHIEEHGTLSVVLMSAVPLPIRLVENAREATSDIIRKAGGTEIFSIKEVPELIGGIKLVIGDTVYDATVAEELYRLEKTFKLSAAGSVNTAREIVECYFESSKKLVPEIHVYSSLERISDIKEAKEIKRQDM